MGYDATDTARAAEKLGRDMDVMSENEAAAYDRYVAAAITGIFASWERLGNDEDCEGPTNDEIAGWAANVADYAMQERRKRLVAARVGEGPTEIVAEAAADAELRSAAVAFVTTHIAPFEDAGKTPEAMRLERAARQYGEAVRRRKAAAYAAEGRPQ